MSEDLLEIWDGAQKYLVTDTALIGSQAHEVPDLALTRPLTHRPVTTTIKLDCEYISGTHAAIYRTGSGFFIVDMGSTNGTYVNNRLIHNPTPLEHGSRVTVGYKDLHVQRWHDRTTSWIPTYALLIGGANSNITIEHELDLLDIEFRGLEYATSRAQAMAATHQGVLRRLRKIADLTTEKSHVWVHYSGHSSTEGLALYDGALSAETVLGALNDIPGKKALSVDGCRSGVFIDVLKERGYDNIAVVAASGSRATASECRTENVTVWGKQHPDLALQYDTRFGNLSNLMIKYLAACRSGELENNGHNASLAGMFEWGVRHNVMQRLQRQGASCYSPQNHTVAIPIQPR